MHIRYRTMAAVSAIALAFAGVAMASTAVAQTPIQVEQGREVSLGVVENGGAATVDPSGAGTLEFIENGPGEPNGELRFTASPSYLGSALINGIDGAGEPITIAVINVVGSNADISSTFTPRPAPGPCIVIESGGNVAFGDVTVGAAKTAPIGTVVRNCSTLTLDLAGVVSEATVQTGAEPIVWRPARERRPPGPNEFRHVVSPDGTSFAILEDQTVEYIGRISPESTTSLEHSLEVGPGSTTGLNSEFNATVTLVAIAA